MIQPDYNVYSHHIYPQFVDSGGDKGPNPEPFQYIQAATGPIGDRGPQGSPGPPGSPGPAGPRGMRKIT